MSLNNSYYHTLVRTVYALYREYSEILSEHFVISSNSIRGDGLERFSVLMQAIENIQDSLTGEELQAFEPIRDVVARFSVVDYQVVHMAFGPASAFLLKAVGNPKTAGLVLMLEVLADDVLLHKPGALGLFLAHLSKVTEYTRGEAYGLIQKRFEGKADPTEILNSCMLHANNFEAGGEMIWVNATISGEDCG